MPRRLSSAEVAWILTDHSFVFVSQKGSHQKFRDASGHTVIVPASRREIPVGTIISIMKQSGLNRELFR